MKKGISLLAGTILVSTLLVGCNSIIKNENVAPEPTVSIPSEASTVVSQEEVTTKTGLRMSVESIEYVQGEDYTFDDIFGESLDDYLIFKVRVQNVSDNPVAFNVEFFRTEETGNQHDGGSIPFKFKKDADGKIDPKYGAIKPAAQLKKGEYLEGRVYRHIEDVKSGNYTLYYQDIMGDKSASWEFKVKKPAKNTETEETTTEENKDE